MSKFEKDFFNRLVNKHGFFMEQYSSDKDGWVAIKYVDNGIYAVIISKESNEKENSMKARTYLQAKGRKFSIHNVILVDSIPSVNEIVDYNRVFVNGHTGRVLKYDPLSEPLVRIIASLISNINSGSGGIKETIKSFKKPTTPTTILIAVNIAFFLISVIMSGSIGDINTGVLVTLGAKENYLISHGQFYRLLTSMFLHGGIIHLAFNMYALYSLGNLVEQIYGVKKYMIIYFVSGLFASFTSYILSPYISVGASGAIFGLMGACLVFGFKEKHRIGKNFFMELASVVVLNVIIGLSQANIDNTAHFGGLFAGAATAFVIYYKTNIMKFIEDIKRR